MSKAQLVRLLQNAYSGERAAAFAYSGHAKAVTLEIESAEIKKIELEELDHRSRLLQMLIELDAKPRPSRELIFALIGKTISFFCWMGGILNLLNIGWYFSMYGAGKFESGNIVEYEIAAKYAWSLGYQQYVSSLLHMAEVEWDHEYYFRNNCLKSGWSRIIKTWPPPPARELIQKNFLEYCSSRPQLASSKITAL